MELDSTGISERERDLVYETGNLALVVLSMDLVMLD
jgi:hypothetical protein